MTDEELRQLEDKINSLEKKVNELLGKQEELNKSASSYVQKVGEGGHLWKSTYKSVGSIYTKLSEFTVSLDEQYKLSEKIAESYKQTSVNIGIGTLNQKKLGNEFGRSLKLVQMLGGDIDDVTTIYNRFAENSGRVRILDDEEVQRIFAIEKSTGIAGDSISALAERFDLIGIGSKQFADNINHIMVDSQKIGLNSSKVIKVLSDNFETMQRMSFKSGVKGMTEMSKLAVKMRMDISEMLGMADKFYEPEAAIEAAAQLQLMGGDIAEAFGDPFETMYLARNKPEELAKRLQGMTENMVAFNEETGQYELPAEARQQLSFAAEQLGLAKESVIDMAFQSSKIKDIKLSVGGDFTEEQLDKISSIAKYKDGQWKVDVEGQSIAVEELDSTSLEKALAAPTDVEDAAKITAMESMTTNEKLQSIFEATQTGIAIETKFYEAIEKQMSPQIDTLVKGNNKIIENFTGVVKEKFSNIIPEGTMDKITSTTSQITNATIEGIIKSVGGVDRINKIIDEGIIIKKTKEGGDTKSTPIMEDNDVVSLSNNKNKIKTGYSNIVTSNNKDNTPVTSSKKLQESINTQSNQNVTHNGTIKVEIPTITFNMGDGNESVNLTPEQKKIVQNMVISNMVKGMNSNIQSGTGTDGTTNVLTPDY